LVWLKIRGKCKIANAPHLSKTTGVLPSAGLNHP
jgi:hypothetical protein